jgi:transposase
VLVLVDHTPGQERIIDLLPSRSKAALCTWLTAQRQTGAWSRVTEVTCDLWEPYRHAVRETLGFEPTADRFHVQHQFNQRLDQTRRELQRKLPEQQKDALKGLRWLLLKPSPQLSAAEQLRLKPVRDTYPEIQQLLDCRDQLRALFDNPQLDSPQKGKAALEAWMVPVRGLGSHALNKFCATLSRWIDPISRYFISRANNGRTEGYNRGIRMLVSRAFGLPSFPHLRWRVLGLFG